MFTEKIFARKIALEILAKFRCQKMIFRSIFHFPRKFRGIPRFSVSFSIPRVFRGKWKMENGIPRKFRAFADLCPLLYLTNDRNFKKVYN